MNNGYFYATSKHHKTLDETKIKKQKTQPKTGKSSGEKWFSIEDSASLHEIHRFVLSSSFFILEKKIFATRRKASDYALFGSPNRNFSLYEGAIQRKKPTKVWIKIFTYVYIVPDQSVTSHRSLINFHIIRFLFWIISQKKTLQHSQSLIFSITYHLDLFLFIPLVLNNNLLIYLFILLPLL